MNNPEKISHDFDKETPHHEWETMKVQIAQTYDGTRLTVQLNDGQVQRVTFTEEELHNLVDLMDRFIKAHMVMKGDMKVMVQP